MKKLLYSECIFLMTVGQSARNYPIPGQHADKIPESLWGLAVFTILEICTIIEHLRADLRQVQ